MRTSTGVRAIAGGNIRAEHFGCIDLNPIWSFTDHYPFD
jgi:hypothetical protein